MKHTTTPWTHIADANLECRHVIALDPEEPGCAQMIANVISPANAAHIVHCVNQHDRLVDALRKALVFCEAEQECREASCLPEPTKDEEPYLEEASETVDLLRATLAAEDAYESEVGK